VELRELLEDFRPNLSEAEVSSFMRNMDSSNSNGRIGRCCRRN
jgi:hypothetical protein